MCQWFLVKFCWGAWIDQKTYVRFCESGFASPPYLGHLSCVHFSSAMAELWTIQYMMCAGRNARCWAVAEVRNFVEHVERSSWRRAGAWSNLCSTCCSAAVPWLVTGEEEEQMHCATSLISAPVIVVLKLICWFASGVLLGLQGKKATCHPGFTDKLKDQTAVEGRVVIDGLLVTSRGPGTAMEFALAIVEKLFGSKKAKELVSHLVIDE